MRQVRDNPTNNRSITVTSFTYASTSTDGLVTSLSDISSITLGQSVFLNITGGSAEGFVSGQEYFAIPVDTNNIKLASSYVNAVAGTTITTTGDAGGGTIYPTYKVGGTLFVGTGGNANVRGLNASGFTPLKNIPDGAALPYMIKDIHSLNTTTTDLVVWCD